MKSNIEMKLPQTQEAAAYSVEYVIRSLSEAQEDLDGSAGAFWSNEDGWAGLESATRFSTAERMSSCLPVSAGGDSEWMLIEEALDLTAKQKVTWSQADFAAARAQGWALVKLGFQGTGFMVQSNVPQRDAVAEMHPPNLGQHAHGMMRWMHSQRESLARA